MLLACCPLLALAAGLQVRSHAYADAWLCLVLALLAGVLGLLACAPGDRDAGPVERARLADLPCDGCGQCDRCDRCDRCDLRRADA